MAERIQFGTDEIVKIAEKTNCRCAKCNSQDNLHIHHIVPLSQGGDNNLSNLILLCQFCHKKVHKNMETENIYDEEKYYSENYGHLDKEEILFSDLDYEREDTGWKIDIDCTDHFDFCCPKCKCHAIISKINLRGYNSLDTPPCFYFYFKCPRCKIKGQRKAYVNYSSKQIKSLKENFK